MTEYALRLQNDTDTAPRIRAGDALPLAPGMDGTGGRSGLRPGGGGEVSVVSGSMSVQVEPFTAWVRGTSSSSQGGYPFVLDATKTLTLSDGHASLARVDTIVAVVREDAFDGSGETSATLEVVQGTPGAGQPALPASAVALRDVNVPAGVSTGTGGLSPSNLGGDRRTYTAALGGILPVSGATERDTTVDAYPGMPVYRMDTGKLEVFDGTDWQAYKKDDGLRTEVGGGSVTTDADANFVITHSLGVVPTAIMVMAQTGTRLTFRVVGLDTASVTLEAFNVVTNAQHDNATFSCNWQLTATS